MPDASDSRSPRPLLIYLARLRVPLGFMVGTFAIWLARPTMSSLAMGLTVAIFGEVIRFWAAGHLEKGCGITTSGPYRWSCHPLYLGSAIIGVGFMIASAQLSAAVLVGVYLAVTLLAAVRIEQIGLRTTFGRDYVLYEKGITNTVGRRFCVSRVLKNREQRAVMGLLAVVLILAIKACSR